jgi:PAS domain S-box-containing protein
MLCTANAEGYLLELNGAWTATLDYSPDELRSRPYIELIHPTDRAKVKREMARTFEGHGPAMFDCRFRAEDGDWRWLLWSASFSHETGLIFARATDITAAKELDRADRPTDRHPQPALARR